MRSLVAVAACACLVACASVKAEPMFVGDNVHVTFHSDECKHPELAMFLIVNGGLEPRRATVNASGQMFQACYIVDDEGDYLVVDVHGRGGFLPGKQIQHGA
jgi:hypothetical protein